MLSLRIRDARGLGGDSDPEFEAPIAPTLSGAENGNFVSASMLGKLDVDLPATLRPAVQQAVDKFSQDELHSKPISFYSWSGELEALFRQDRLLQTELRDPEGTAAIVKALQADTLRANNR
jgi:hypothetical protein